MGEAEAIEREIVTCACSHDPELIRRNNLTAERVADEILKPEFALACETEPAAIRNDDVVNPDFAVVPDFIENLADRISEPNPEKHIV